MRRRHRVVPAPPPPKVARAATLMSTSTSKDVFAGHSASLVDDRPDTANRPDVVVPSLSGVSEIQRGLYIPYRVARAHLEKLCVNWIGERKHYEDLVCRSEERLRRLTLELKDLKDERVALKRDFEERMRLSLVERDSRRRRHDEDDFVEERVVDGRDPGFETESSKSGSGSGSESENSDLLEFGSSSELSSEEEERNAFRGCLEFGEDGVKSESHSQSRPHHSFERSDDVEMDSLHDDDDSALPELPNSDVASSLSEKYASQETVERLELLEAELARYKSQHDELVEEIHLKDEKVSRMKVLLNGLSELQVERDDLRRELKDLREVQKMKIPLHQSSEDFPEKPQRHLGSSDVPRDQSDRDLPHEDSASPTSHRHGRTDGSLEYIEEPSEVADFVGEDDGGSIDSVGEDPAGSVRVDDDSSADDDLIENSEPAPSVPLVDTTIQTEPGPATSDFSGQAEIEDEGLATDLSSLRSEVKVYATRAQELEEQLGREADATKELEETVATQASQLSTLKANKLFLEEERSDARTRVQTLIEELAKSKLQLQNKTSEIQKLRTSHESTMRSHSEENVLRIERLQTELQKIREEATEKSRELRATISEKEKSLVSMGTKISKLESDLSASESELASSLQASGGQLANLKKAQQELIESKSLNEDLSASVASLSKENEQFESLSVSLRKRNGSLTSSVASYRLQLVSWKARFDHSQQELRESEDQRRKLHNKIEDSKGKIRVFLRCRPLNSRESARGAEDCIEFNSASQVTVNDRERQISKPYQFTRAFPGTAAQIEVYGECRDLVMSAVEGYNVCVFAYGQSGSGKTYTIAGEPGNEGIVPRAIRTIFQLVLKRSRMLRYRIESTLVELYLDSLRDLYSSDRTKTLLIKKNVRGQVVVMNATKLAATTADELLSQYNHGCSTREVRSTGLNDASSRSHLVLTIHILAHNPANKSSSFGKLSLVDLAGSERISKSALTDEAGLREGMAINQSLSSLGNVINALSNRSKHIPYRDSKLTMLLSDSVGGSAKTLMFVNVSPCDPPETMNSLVYATRASKIINRVEKMHETNQNRRLRMRIEILRKKLREKCQDDDEYDGILELVTEELRSGGSQQAKETPAEASTDQSLKIPTGQRRRSRTPTPARPHDTQARRSRTPRGRH